MSSILLFAGSARQNSLNRQLIAQAAHMVQSAGADATVLELGALNLPLYNADIESLGTPAAAIELKTLMHSHAGWIIATPEYNASITALLKNAIDWASSPARQGANCSAEQAAFWKSGTKAFAGKVVGLLSAAPGAMGGLRSMDQLAPILRNLQCWVAPQQFALGRAREAFDELGLLKDADAASKVKAVVEQVVFAATKLS